MTYRLVKCCLEDTYPEEYNTHMDTISNKLDLFLNHILLEDNPSIKRDEELSQFREADKRVTTLTDRVARFLITNARQFPGISGILDESLLEEVLSKDSSDEIIAKTELGGQTEDYTSLQESL